MKLNKLGMLANKYWKDIPNHLPHVSLLEHIVMPNHLHGIILIKGYAKLNSEGEDWFDTASRVATQSGLKEAFGAPNKGTLPTIIRSYKSGVSREINRLYAEPLSPFWQRGYFKRVIRTEKELLSIIKYIRDNPKNWDKDPDNPRNNL
jgi:putative transposase